MKTVVGRPAFAKVRLEAQLRPLRGRRGQKQMCEGDAPPSEPQVYGRVMRIARLMALAIRMRDLLQSGAVRDYAELARLGHVTRARVTQIMNLLNLAPEIQEEILFLPPVERGRDPIREWQLRPIAGVPDWRKQRRMWCEVRRRVNTQLAS